MHFFSTIGRLNSLGKNDMLNTRNNPAPQGLWDKFIANCWNPATNWFNSLWWVKNKKRYFKEFYHVFLGKPVEPFFKRHLLTQYPKTLEKYELLYVYKTEEDLALVRGKDIKNILELDRSWKNLDGSFAKPQLQILVNRIVGSYYHGKLETVATREAIEKNEKIFREYTAKFTERDASNFDAIFILVKEKIELEEKNKALEEKCEKKSAEVKDKDIYKAQIAKNKLRIEELAANIKRYDCATAASAAECKTGNLKVEVAAFDWNKGAVENGLKKHISELQLWHWLGTVLAKPDENKNEAEREIKRLYRVCAKNPSATAELVELVELILKNDAAKLFKDCHEAKSDIAVKCYLKQLIAGNRYNIFGCCAYNRIPPSPIDWPYICPLTQYMAKFYNPDGADVRKKLTGNKSTQALPITPRNLSPMARSKQNSPVSSNDAKIKNIETAQIEVSVHEQKQETEKKLQITPSTPTSAVTPKELFKKIISDRYEREFTKNKPKPNKRKVMTCNPLRWIAALASGVAQVTVYTARIPIVYIVTIPIAVCTVIGASLVNDVVDLLTFMGRCCCGKSAKKPSQKADNRTTHQTPSPKAEPAFTRNLDRPRSCSKNRAHREENVPKKDEKKFDDNLSLPGAMPALAIDVDAKPLRSASPVQEERITMVPSPRALSTAANVASMLSAQSAVSQTADEESTEVIAPLPKFGAVRPTHQRNHTNHSSQVFTWKIPAAAETPKKQQLGATRFSKTTTVR